MRCLGDRVQEYICDILSPARVQRVTSKGERKREGVSAAGAFLHTTNRTTKKNANTLDVAGLERFAATRERNPQATAGLRRPGAISQTVEEPGASPDLSTNMARKWKLRLQFAAFDFGLLTNLQPLRRFSLTTG